MANYQTAFKAEVARLARKELNASLGVLRKASAQHRRDIAALKRQVATLERRLAFLEGREKKRLEKGPSKPAERPLRFSAKGLKAHRARLGLSALEYGRLVGVSHITIYNWEHEKVRPRQKQLEALAAVRRLGKREALQRLELLEA